LEQVAAHSPSAVDRKVSNDRKTEPNSFVAKELSYSKKNDFQAISLGGGSGKNEEENSAPVNVRGCVKLASAMQSIRPQ